MNHAAFCETERLSAISIAANPILAVGEEPDCSEPFIEADGRVFHH